jgi:hypothetical protein
MRKEPTSALRRRAAALEEELKRLRQERGTINPG